MSNPNARQARWFFFCLFGEDTRAMGRFAGNCMCRLCRPRILGKTLTCIKGEGGTTPFAKSRDSPQWYGTNTDKRYVISKNKTGHTSFNVKTIDYACKNQGKMAPTAKDPVALWIEPNHAFSGAKGNGKKKERIKWIGPRLPTEGRKRKFTEKVLIL